ncbi:hypothetical protein OQA88_3028 [Cercophora sp. LCS_1]
MRLASIIIGLGFTSGAFAACGWILAPDDCICMNSTDGSLLKKQTSDCCWSMGYRTAQNVGGHVRALVCCSRIDADFETTDLWR